jgi:hypothetical protein
MAPTSDNTAPTPADWAAVRQMLEAYKRENEELRTRQAPNTKNGNKPDRYEGSRKPRAIESWLKTLDDYFELNPSQRATERTTILTAASYLTESAKGDYNSHVAWHGEFETWDNMKEWLLETYNPVDPINTNRDNFFLAMRQRTGESPDDFYRRFLDAANLLDVAIEETLLTYFFSLWVLPYYQKQIRSDTEFAKWDKPLDTLVAKIKRGPPPPSSDPSPGRISNIGARQNLSRRITSTDARPNKRPRISDTGTKTTSSGSGDDAPLTDGQRRFLDQNIAKGGGIVISDLVQGKSAWIKEAMQRNLCINCAGSGHLKANCPATKPSDSSSSSTSSLNAIFPGSDFINNDEPLN